MSNRFTEGRIDLDGADEGPADLIEHVVNSRLAVIRRLSRHDPDESKRRFYPVLRGTDDWPPETIARLSEDIRRHGMGGVVYQGSEFLAGPPPCPGWA